MTATDSPIFSFASASDMKIPMPLIAGVKPAKGLQIIVRWKQGIRPLRRAELVDLSPLIQTFKFYRPLRHSRKLFQTVHVIDGGNAIAWGDDDNTDMSATSVERLAEETMTASEFRIFLKANSLTQQEAGAVLGRSQRQIAFYLAGKPIPRIVALACYGYVARKNLALTSMPAMRGSHLGLVAKTSTKNVDTKTYISGTA